MYTETLPVTWRVAEALHSMLFSQNTLWTATLWSLDGVRGVNVGIVSDPIASFGGIKESGFGREGGDMV